MDAKPRGEKLGRNLNFKPAVQTRLEFVRSLTKISNARLKPTSKQTLRLPSLVSKGSRGRSHAGAPFRPRERSFNKKGCSLSLLQPPPTLEQFNAVHIIRRGNTSVDRGMFVSQLHRTNKHHVLLSVHVNAYLCEHLTTSPSRCVKSNGRYFGGFPTLLVVVVFRRYFQ